MKINQLKLCFCDTEAQLIDCETYHNLYPANTVISIENN